MRILVIAEHDHLSLKSSTLNTIGAARKIGGEIDVLVAGANCVGAAEQAATLQGVVPGSSRPMRHTMRARQPKILLP